MRQVNVNVGKVTIDEFKPNNNWNIIQQKKPNQTKEETFQTEKLQNFEDDEKSPANEKKEFSKQQKLNV